MESVNEMIIVVACASTILWLDLSQLSTEEDARKWSLFVENIRPWVAQEISINYIQKLFAPMEQTGVFVRKTMSTCIQMCISISICMCICHAYPWFTQQSCVLHYMINLNICGYIPWFAQAIKSWRSSCAIYSSWVPVTFHIKSV